MITAFTDLTMLTTNFCIDVLAIIKGSPAVDQPHSFYNTRGQMQWQRTPLEPQPYLFVRGFTWSLTKSFSDQKTDINETLRLSCNVESRATAQSPL